MTGGPAILGYTLPLDFLNIANGFTVDLGNSFTVLGGAIVDATFGRINTTEGLLLSNDNNGGLTFLNVVGSANALIGVTDTAGTTLSFSAVAPVPLPAGLPLLLAGLGGLGMMARRKRNA